MPEMPGALPRGRVLKTPFHSSSVIGPKRPVYMEESSDGKGEYNERHRSLKEFKSGTKEGGTPAMD
jgi:hypothetical protein